MSEQMSEWPSTYAPVLKPLCISVSLVLKPLCISVSLVLKPLCISVSLVPLGELVNEAERDNCPSSGICGSLAERNFSFFIGIE